MSMLARQYNQPKRPGDLDLLTLKVVSESRDMDYLCANYSLPRPLCSRVMADVHDTQTSDKALLNAPAY